MQLSMKTSRIKISSMKTTSHNLSTKRNMKPFWLLFTSTFALLSQKWIRKIRLFMLQKRPLKSTKTTLKFITKRHNLTFNISTGNPKISRLDFTTWIRRMSFPKTKIFWFKCTKLKSKLMTKNKSKSSGLNSCSRRANKPKMSKLRVIKMSKWRVRKKCREMK